MTRRIVANPQDFGKLGKIGALNSMSWAKINTYYYDFTRFDLPLTAAEFSTEFGNRRNVFDNQGDDPGCGRQTNAATGSGVNEAFIALGTGVIAIGEGEAFSTPGRSDVRPQAETTTPLAEVLTNSGGTPLGDCYCGVVDLSNAPATSRHATLWWGAPTWRFIEKFFQAYRLQILINHRFQVVDESLFDVGMVPTPPEFVGASDSTVPTMPFIRAVNDTMAAKGINNAFVPGNYFLKSENESACLPPPRAGVTYGHPRIIGLGNRIYCFNQPLLFLPGMRFEVFFQNVEDASCYTALQNSVVTNCTTPDALYTANTGADIVDGCGEHCTIPGGSVSLGVVFKGFALWPQAVMEYMSNFLVSGSVTSAMYSDSDYLMGVLAKSKSFGDDYALMAGNIAGVLGKPQLTSGND